MCGEGGEGCGVEGGGEGGGKNDRDRGEAPVGRERAASSEQVANNCCRQCADYPLTSCRAEHRETDQCSELNLVFCQTRSQ